MLRAIFVLIVLLKLTLGAPADLVPALNVVDAKNRGFILQPNEDGYQLAIRGVGHSLAENVAQDEEGELHVQGVINQKFDNKVKLIVKYIADTEGYRASYRIRLQEKKPKKPKQPKQPTKKPDTEPIDKPDFPDDDDEDKPFVLTIAIKATCLKSCVG
ncbi:uncharacterized protein LOC133850882 [Drosophila sulfurigaster albostrigata]|uniref:uncharacterized protein LOC133850882 n=1 Tax=Drosophila sulfurigaster albostrigata TaxID=89887 RepID=UPI002D21EB1C|nr:uncharacterized protein LOC133850882 [Drosophila sulfurigaster albostrigata]